MWAFLIPTSYFIQLVLTNLTKTKQKFQYTSKIRKTLVMEKVCTELKHWLTTELQTLLSSISKEKENLNLSNYTYYITSIKYPHKQNYR